MIPQAGSPYRKVELLRGGLTIGAGLIAGNILGFIRVAIIAYLLGTRGAADTLAVAIGPLDTLNSVLINTMVFAFVPMLTERQGADRLALFAKLNRIFSRIFTAITFGLIVAAPWLIRVLAPGLAAQYYGQAANLLRIGALSCLAAGAAAIHSALLYTDRRFAPSAFYQASLNLFTIGGAITLWPLVGVYGFAIGYATGAWVQFAIVYWSARRGVQLRGLPHCAVNWRELTTKPGSILAYAVAMALNVTFTRAYATHAGPGMAAALEYCMRGVSVPMALLVSPLSNSLLPEIARLRAEDRLRAAYRLIDKTIGLVALVAIAGCAIALALREPVIALMFQRGSFTAESTRTVSAVFLGMGPSVVGWSLMELTSRSLFALDRQWLPLSASLIPLTCNAVISLSLGAPEPSRIGVGASTGLLTGFLVLFATTRWARRK